MILNKPYSSQEIAQVVERWRPCEFFVMGIKKPIVTLSHYELYMPHSWAHCSAQAIEKIKTALKQAYDEGVREVGLVCAPYVQEQLINAALSIVDDVTWKIYPHFEFTYDKNLMETKQKIWNESLILAQTEKETDEMLEQFANAMGFTPEILEELRQYEHVTDVKELPEHLRILFRDGVSEENE